MFRHFSIAALALALIVAMFSLSVSGAPRAEAGGGPTNHLMGGGESIWADISSSAQMTVGQTFYLKVTLTSTFQRDVLFSGVVFVGTGAAIQNGAPAVSTGSQVLLSEADGQRFFWSGGTVVSVSGGSATLTIPMVARTTGTNLVRARFLTTTLQELVEAQKTLTIVAPSPSPSKNMSWQVKLGGEFNKPLGIWSKLVSQPKSAVYLTRYISTKHGIDFPSSNEVATPQGKVFEFKTDPFPFGLALASAEGQPPFASAQWNTNGRGCNPGPQATFQWKPGGVAEVVATNRGSQDVSALLTIDAGTTNWSTLKAGETRTFSMKGMKKQGLVQLMTGIRCGELYMTPLP